MLTDIQHRLLAEEINKWIPFNGKRILEIGCGNGDLLKFIAKYYSPEFMVGIDPRLDIQWHIEESSGPNWKVTFGNAESLDFADNYFDAVISIDTFEHIGDITTTLCEAKRVLKPYGRFYTRFGPIWSSVAGHHWITRHNWNEKHLALIPPWGHLYMSEIELRAHLDSLEADESIKERALNYIYHINTINRKSKSEFVSAIHKSEMAIRLYSELLRFSRFSIPGQNELTPEITERIIAAGYLLSDVGVMGMKICMEKLAAC